jgi:hypothetical protein
MTAITNTYSRYDAKGIREDLANVIYNISPEDTPFTSNIGRGTASNTIYEWQVDELAAAVSNNAVVEGDDVTSFTAAVATDRLANYTQISRKDVLISGTLEKLDKAGRRSEIAYQLSKKGAELKRDIESSALANQAAVAGSMPSTARRTAGLPAFLRTNSNRSTGATPGADPTVSNGLVNAAATDGTQRAFTEAMLKDVIQKVWTEGGTPKMLMVGPGNKVVASTFTGIADIRYNLTAPKTAAIIGAADVYVSDFGQVSIVPNRFQRNRDAFVLDPEYCELAWLRPITQVELAKTGDAEKRMLIGEWGLKVKQQKALGVIADLS